MHILRLVLLVLLVLIAALIYATLEEGRAIGAELQLPAEIVFGHSTHDSLHIDRFGTYSDQYYAKRWERMCNTAARSNAMREASEQGKPNPC